MKYSLKKPRSQAIGLTAGPIVRNFQFCTLDLEKE